MAHWQAFNEVIKPTITPYAGKKGEAAKGDIMNEMLIAKDAERYTQEIENAKAAASAKHEKVKWKAVPFHTPSFYLPEKKVALVSAVRSNDIRVSGGDSAWNSYNYTYPSFAVTTNEGYEIQFTTCPDDTGYAKAELSGNKLVINPGSSCICSYVNECAVYQEISWKKTNFYL